ncbi:ubiquinone/menaquinone biosynthesis C-methylase UbiE [Nocardia tenerifensis]|uniref:Ubiquinone/menaquinone biosynthesis C-methylase UbiE n=1 Tax=Nocardia tenerifensis TaxID=228006 RepID=A0A318K2S9_9NOCA|nr:class I SAM-dependent methyltransferase [Nocardia tenerifensis]PXX65591.1 ubiquinone/menaquinone biosynthesis C-methylase UbiE [Nocardia tenerifensis]
MNELSNAPADVAVTRAAYNDVAELYTEIAKNNLAENPHDRAMLALFAELVGAGTPVADIGCGPGRLTAHLHSLGLSAFGIDLSPEMIAIARRQYPGLSFEVGTMERLALADAGLRGLIAWYSLIHLPPDRMPEVSAELYRVLEVGGHALLAFFATDAPGAVEAFEHRVTRAYRWSPERLAAVLRDVGFTVRTRMIREPDPGERFQQAYLLVSKVG